MKRKIVIIMNPKAGKGGAKSNLFTICERFSAMGDHVQVCVTQYSHHAHELTEYYGSTVDILVCMGGDGTWNEVVSGLMALRKRPTLCYLATGTVNDFASSLKLAKKADHMMQQMMKNTIFACDVGQFNKRYFTYIAAFGIFTEISYSTSQGSKNTFGKVAYFLEGIKQLTRIPRYHIRVESDEGIIEDDCIFGCITNSRYIAGFTNINSKDAQLDDGLFEVLFIRVPNNPLDVQNIVASLLKHEVNKTWMYFLKTSSLKISSTQEIPWTLDGEDGGVTTKAEILNKHKAISIFV